MTERIPRISLLGLAATGLLFGSGCAYNQVMDEREAERESLEQQLDYENSRSGSLRSPRAKPEPGSSAAAPVKRVQVSPRERSRPAGRSVGGAPGFSPDGWQELAVPDPDMIEIFGVPDPVVIE